MKKYLLILVLLPAIFFSRGQPIALSVLPAYDCTLKDLMGILGRPTILLTPDSDRVPAVTAEYCGDLGGHCLRKTVTAMADSDYRKPLFVVGVVHDFAQWARLRLPVKRVRGGFSVNGVSFTDSTAGFALIDSNHIVVCGNNPGAVKQLQLAFTGGYGIEVMEKGKITWFGNRHGGSFAWFNLQRLKETNYNRKASTLFSGVYISKTFSTGIDFDRLNDSLLAYAKQFTGIYHLRLPVSQVSWFLHSNLKEFAYMSGMFGLLCPGNSSGGFSIRGEIHTNGYNLPLVKHEYSHFLFDSNIPQDNNPAFFVEGCVEYVTSLNDTGVMHQRIAIAKLYDDSLNFRDLILRNADFYGKYSSANYSVCGIFVKYLVDTYGVEKFKTYCLTPDKAATTETVFGKDFDHVRADYRDWLRQQ